MMTSAELRHAFLNYFKQKEHTIVPSSSIVPHGDPTLLFVNSGMVQFKNVFLGVEQRPYKRATTAQKCIRAGGKHNDLENVGYTARHHTFFEMLGNFSFGDYFKIDAIKYAWQFLTEILKLPAEKLWITVYKDDNEAADIWIKQMGIAPERVLRCDEQDNFWRMGDTGPCGPCTEIYYDHGAHIAGGLPGTPDADGDRYVEIWNLVFMQYEQHSDGSLTPLPSPSVDTGMGLERVAAVLQGVHSNYDIDLFVHLIKAAKKLAPKANQNILQILADHIRASAFLITEGVMPDNEGRGYVLRRIIRRAIRHGYQAGIPLPFFYRLVPALVEIMGDAYPQLKTQQAFIAATLKNEEQQFAITLEQGMKLLQQAFNEATDKQLSGELIFKLYDTYGFPVDLTADAAREQGFTLDQDGFELAMAKQRQQSQRTQKFSSEALTQYSQQIKDRTETQFTGYELLEEAQATITTILYDDEKQIIGLILNRTPFYAESGGQAGDQGIITKDKNQFIVNDTRKFGQQIVHYGEVKHGKFTQGMQITATVDHSRRQATALNHSATHLLHAALRQLLGSHVYQKGSLVNAERLRFDFSHPNPLIDEEIIKLETIVNQQIRANYAGEVSETSPEDAIKAGALALFGEKYGDKVRTLKFGDFSHELCGGTHVKRTGDIGVFKILSETGIASGIRRIEAITGSAVIEWLQQADQQLHEMNRLLNANDETQLIKLQLLIEQNKEAQKELAQAQLKSTQQRGQALLTEKIMIENITLLVAYLESADIKTLRTILDQVKSQICDGIILLASNYEERAYLLLNVTQDLSTRFPAMRMLEPLSAAIGGRGGGKSTMAQSGGEKNIKKLSTIQPYLVQCSTIAEAFVLIKQFLE